MVQLELPADVSDPEPCCPEGRFRSGLPDLICWLALGCYLVAA